MWTIHRLYEVPVQLLDAGYLHVCFQKKKKKKPPAALASRESR